MEPITAMMLATGVAKSLANLFDDSSSKQAAMMREQAAMKKSALEETMRRAEGQQTQVLSSTKARMAASGFASDSDSFKGYLTDMAAEFQKQNEFTRNQGMRQVDLMQQAADATEPNMLTKGIAFAGDIFGMADKAKKAGLF